MRNRWTAADLAAFVLLSLPTGAAAAPTSPFFGVWESTNAEPPVRLMIFDGQHFYWNQETGRFLTDGGAVWFLEENKTGTKWDFRVTDDELRLTAPEDFKYLGGGEYLYLQFTAPQTELHFRQAIAFGQAYPTQTFDNGQPQTTISFQDPQTGVQRQYRPDGTKEAEIHFKDGQLHGAYTTWDPSGQIIETKQYAAGALVE